MSETTIKFFEYASFIGLRTFLLSFIRNRNMIFLILELQKFTKLKLKLTGNLRKKKKNYDIIKNDSQVYFNFGIASSVRYPREIGRHAFELHSKNLKQFRQKSKLM